MGAFLAIKAGHAHSSWIKKVCDIQLLWTRVQLRRQRRIKLLHLLQSLLKCDLCRPINRLHYLRGVQSVHISQQCDRGLQGVAACLSH